MQVFIAGATGVLGRPLVTQLVEKGHTVRALARSDANEGLLRRLGAEPVRGDLFDTDALAMAVEGSEVVVHAATAIPVKSRTARADWALNDRIRTEGTRALTSAAARAGARVYLQQSIVWVASTPDGAPFDETSPATATGILRSALDGEEIAREAGERHGFATGVLRLGVLHAAEAAHTRFMADELRKRRLPLIGRADNIIAPLHADDAASAFVVAAERGRPGLWHVVDDAPLPMGQYLREFARLLGAPAPRRVPVWLARLLAGSLTLSAVTASMNTTNARFRAETGWRPRYPTFRDGMTAILRQWAEEEAKGKGKGKGSRRAA